MMKPCQRVVAIGAAFDPDTDHGFKPGPIARKRPVRACTRVVLPTQTRARRPSHTRAASVLALCRRVGLGSCSVLEPACPKWLFPPESPVASHIRMLHSQSQSTRGPTHGLTYRGQLVERGCTALAQHALPLFDAVRGSLPVVFVTHLTT